MTDGGLQHSCFALAFTFFLPRAFSHAHAYARVSTAISFFCCHKCHTTSSQAAHLLANNTLLSSKQHVVFYKTTRHFQQNNTSFSTKQHVTFNKTIRHFQQNITSFSIKRHVTFNKTTRFFSIQLRPIGLAKTAEPKLFIKTIIIHSQSKHYTKACDTCDSKIAKTLCRARVRVRARTKEKHFLASFFGLRC